jgi:hypothetical protein
MLRASFRTGTTMETSGNELPIAASFIIRPFATRSPEPASFMGR